MRDQVVSGATVGAAASLDRLASKQDRQGRGACWAHAPRSALGRKLLPGGAWRSIASLIFASTIATTFTIGSFAHAAEYKAGPADAGGRHGVETSYLVQARGIVGENLFDSGARRGGVPEKIMRQMVALLGFVVDFQRDLRAEDGFELLYEQSFLRSGALGPTGALVYAGLDTKNRRFGVWRFTPPNGVTDYFNSKGESVRSDLLRTPLNAARIASRFGQRKHPILGFARTHRGIDFAVPTGTPVLAAGEGIVEAAGRNATFGKFVRIRHKRDYRTVYAHLSRISKWARRGARVRQRRVIGRSGASGLATGPHLHYEVWRGRDRIDPASLGSRPQVTLRGKALTTFHWHAAMTKLRPALRLDELKQTARKRR